MAFNAKEYWNTRLDKEFSLRGVGYITFSERYNDWLYQRKTKVLTTVFKRYCPDLTGKKVLDIGCGTGFFVQHYLNRGAKVTGLDITTQSIKQLSARFPQSEFHLRDIGEKDAALAEQFDVINMWDVMYHIVNKDAFENACKNIAAMSKKDTLFLVTDFLGSDKGYSPAEHVVFRGVQQYKEVLGAQGYTLCEVLPLYRYLNRHYRWSDTVTNWMAPMLYFMDNQNSKIIPNNIAVGVWKYGK